MCTVTLVPRIDAGGTGVGLRMLCNRDESRQRPAALPPQIRAFSDRRAILPLDAAAGGTWVAVSDAGLAFTLLNRNPQDMRGLDFPGRQSRGQIIPGLLSCASFDEAVAQLKHLNPRHYPPFRLVVADAGHVAVAVGEDDTLRVERFPLVGPVMFTSSGLGDGLVEPPRRALFADIFGSDTTQWETQQDAFHAHRGGGPGELDVCMSRADALSVSLTRVEVGAAGVSMTYHAGPPDQQAPQSTLALPRRETRSRLRRVGRAIARGETALKAAGFTDAQLGRERPRFERAARWFAAFEAERRQSPHAWRPLALERRGAFSFDPPGGVFTVKGRADRIDQGTDGSLALIDYKTGQAPSDDEVQAGFAPQLPLTAAIASRGAFEGVPSHEFAELRYVLVSGGKDPGASHTRPAKIDKKPVKPEALPDASRKLAEDTFDAFARWVAHFDDPGTGYPSQPRRKFQNRYGDYDHLARRREWSAAGAEPGDGGDGAQ